MKPDKEINASDDVAFKRLLQWLSPDAEQAGEQYELLRWKLIEFFEQHACRWPDELADETLERVVRILAQDVEIESIEPGAYCYGVARNVAREYWRQPDRRAIGLDTLPPKRHPAIKFSPLEQQDSLQESQRMECLEQCLQRLSPEKRDLIGRYYQDATLSHIQQRNDLATQLGVTHATLYVRVHRVRQQLGRCVKRCCQQAKKK